MVLVLVVLVVEEVVVVFTREKEEKGAARRCTYGLNCFDKSIVDRLDVYCVDCVALSAGGGGGGGGFHYSWINLITIT